MDYIQFCNLNANLWIIGSFLAKDTITTATMVLFGFAWLGMGMYFLYSRRSGK